MHIKSLLTSIGVCSLTLSISAQTQNSTCPEKQGIYYLSLEKSWVELPQEANPVTTFKPNFLAPTLLKTNKEFAGENAFVALRNPVQLCTVNAVPGASFSLEKAVAKRGTRTIVEVGDFHNNRGAQSQAMASITDEKGNIHLMTTALAAGQYILVMLGRFRPAQRASTGNPQADAMSAAMDSSAAMVAGISSRNQALHFGFGIE